MDKINTFVGSDAGAHTFGADLSADGVFAFDDDIDGAIQQAPHPDLHSMV